jgi:putative PIN family toxin of toxin-antitoxin system
VLVVFDPNILVSALITPKGRARQVVQAGIDGQYEYAICPTLLDELVRVSRRPKIASLVPSEAAARFIADVRGGARLEVDPDVRAVSRDPEDDYLVALALSINADHLVTGDKDLLELAHPAVRITTLRELADLLEPLS